MAYYKTVCCLVVLGLIQFSLATSTTNPVTTKTLTPKAKLLRYYESEITKIHKEFGEKSKNLSEHLLKDERIQHANTTILLEFKNNITDYLNKYETFKQNNLYKTLVLQFSEKTLHYYHKTPETKGDNVYIVQLLNKFGFHKINDDYEHKLKHLFMKQLLKQFEEYKATFKEGELEKDQPLNDWYNLIRTCKEAKCYSEAYYKFLKIMHTPKEELYDFIITSLKDIYIYYGDRAKNISAEILRDESFKNKSTPEIENFKRNLTKFSTTYHSNQNIYDLFNTIAFYNNITLKYNEIPNENVNSNAKFILGVLKKFKTDELEKDFEHKFTEFVERNFIPKFEEFTLKLNKENILKEKVLLDWFQQFKTRKTYGERKQAFDTLSEIFWQSDEKETN